MLPYISQCRLISPNVALSRPMSPYIAQCRLISPNVALYRPMSSNILENLKKVHNIALSRPTSHFVTVTLGPRVFETVLLSFLGCHNNTISGYGGGAFELEALSGKILIGKK